MYDYKVAIIDDDELFAKTLNDYVTNFNINIFTSSTKGIESIKNGNYDILILDFFIDNMNGKDIVQKIREFNKTIYIIVLTGYSSDIPPLKALNEMDIQDYCEKNTSSMDSMIVRLESAVKSLIQVNAAKENLPDNSFANRLKIIRESRGELQNNLAEILKVSRQTI